jgi:alkylation response protein AidB-like acyl-CoA dehydrogenase
MEYYDLDTTLSKEDSDIRRAIHEFAEGVMRPAAKELDQMSAIDAFSPGSPYFSFLKQAYKLGYHKSLLPEEVGGLGLTPSQAYIVMEELAWGSFGLAIGLHTSLHPVDALTFGNEEHVKEFTIPFCDCEDGSIYGTWAITEPDHGTDTLLAGTPVFRDSSIESQCTATKVGDEYVIRGQKSAWASGAPLANYVDLYCSIEEAKGPAGGGIFIFDLDRPGVSKGNPIEKMGARDLPQGELFFDEVVVPKRYLLVGPDKYEEALMTHMAGITLIIVAAWSVGLARAAFEEALDHARKRVQGGKVLFEHSNVQQKLTDMVSHIEAARQYTKYIFDYNLSVPPEKRAFEYAMAAKTYATKVALEVTDAALTLHGAIGLTKDYHIEKLYRDARHLIFCDGSNDSLNCAAGYHIAKLYPRVA